MKKSLFSSIMVVLFAGLITSCKTAQPAFNAGMLTNTRDSSKAANFITITSDNLSEDMSVMSTKNDEIMFLIFPVEGENHNTPLVSFTAVIDPEHASYQQEISLDTATGPFWVLLIEQDSENNVSDIVKLLRDKMSELKGYHDAQSYKDIELIIGDDDVLYIQQHKTINASTQIQINGIHKVDRYSYFISFDAI